MGKVMTMFFMDGHEVRLDQTVHPGEMIISYYSKVIGFLTIMIDLSDQI